MSHAQLQTHVAVRSFQAAALLPRLLRYLNLFMHGIADGRALANAARRRYPFADW